jgi:hypothetical protein
MDIVNTDSKTPRLHNTVGTLVTEMVLQSAESAGLIHLSDDLLVKIIRADDVSRLLKFPIGRDFLAVAAVNRDSDRELVGTIKIFRGQGLLCTQDCRCSAQVRFRIRDGFVIGQDDLRDVTECSIDDCQREQLADALFDETNSCVAE